MGLTVYSKFYYGHTVTDFNNALDFREGSGPELQATIPVGEYTATQFATRVKLAMESVGSFEYDVTFNRFTGRLTIASDDGVFSLLRTTGSRTGAGAWELMGFGDNEPDLTGAQTYTSDFRSGEEFAPQFYLQDYLPSSRNRSAVDGVVNEAASGRLETVIFGERRFVKFDIRYQTNKIPTGSSMIKPDSQGVEKLIQFMDYITTKAPIEFMENAAVPGNFEPLVLEKTAQNDQGLGHEIIERVNDGLPGYFDTGILEFRRLS
jgi:hypothetical protein